MDAEIGHMLIERFRERIDVMAMGETMLGCFQTVLSELCDLRQGARDLGRGVALLLGALSDVTGHLGELFERAVKGIQMPGCLTIVRDTGKRAIMSLCVER